MIILYSIFSILCLCTGFFCGWKLKEEKKLPEVNPIKVVEKIKDEVVEHRKKEEKEKQINTLNDILVNINNYDGTSNNQKIIK